MADDKFPMADGGLERVITQNELEKHLEYLVENWIFAAGVSRLLILPPDHSRLYSQAGFITSWLWGRLADMIHVDVMPALGTHVPMTPDQFQLMFGQEIPFERILHHRWREDIDRLGEIDATEIEELSNGRFGQPMGVEVNRRVVNDSYDLILSIGQVVPHEVIGFANYTKNICIGVGGKDMIHKSHFLGAICGPEQVIGRALTPVRKAVDNAFDRFVRPRANIRFILTVMQESPTGAIQRGLFAGSDWNCFEAATDLSKKVNITLLDKPIHRCVAFLDPREFHSTWLGNKSIYRTRMAMADGGELVVLAPGIKTFGEDQAIDTLIRRHGYRGTEAALQAVQSDPEMRENLSAAAHLIHGSSEGRFRITYGVGDGMTQQEIESVGFAYRHYDDVASEFDVTKLNDGWNQGQDGEPFYFVRNPALGLWSTRVRFGE